MDRNSHEWTLLYGPLVNHLFASFGLALETRRLSLCLDVFRVLALSASSLPSQPQQSQPPPPPPPQQSTQSPPPSSQSQELPSIHATSSDRNYRTLPWSLAALAMSLGTGFSPPPPHRVANTLSPIHHG